MKSSFALKRKTLMLASFYPFTFGKSREKVETIQDLRYNQRRENHV